MLKLGPLFPLLADQIESKFLVSIGINIRDYIYIPRS